MAVPSLLLTLLYRLGVARQSARLQRDRPFLYFYAGLVGYAVGIVVTLAVADLWHAAQPALLFLVPATVLPVVVAAVAHGEAAAVLWQPPPELDAPKESVTAP